MLASIHAIPFIAYVPSCGFSTDGSSLSVLLLSLSCVSFATIVCVTGFDNISEIPSASTFAIFVISFFVIPFCNLSAITLIVKSTVLPPFNPAISTIAFPLPILASVLFPSIDYFAEV